MTVQTTDYLVRHAGDGSTVEFDVPFRFLADSDLTVQLLGADGVATDWEAGVDFTVSGAGDPAGGLVTAATAPAAGTYLTIWRQTDDRQLSNYEENDGFPKATIERDQDRRAMIDQETRGALARTLRAPLSDPEPLAPLSSWNARVGTLVGFDLNGQPRAFSVNEFIETGVSGVEDWGWFDAEPEATEDWGWFDGSAAP